MTYDSLTMNTPEKKLSLSSEAELGDPTCWTPQTSLKHRSLFSEIELFRTICQMGEHPTATRHKGERQTVDFQPDITSHTHHAHTVELNSPLSYLRLSDGFHCTSCPRHSCSEERETTYSLNGSLKKQEFPVLLDVLLRGLHIWVWSDCNRRTFFLLRLSQGSAQENIPSNLWNRMRSRWIQG